MSRGCRSGIRRPKSTLPNLSERQEQYLRTGSSTRKRCKSKTGRLKPKSAQALPDLLQCLDMGDTSVTNSKKLTRKNAKHECDKDGGKAKSTEAWAGPTEHDFPNPTKSEEMLQVSSDAKVVGSFSSHARERGSSRGNRRQCTRQLDSSLKLSGWDSCVCDQEPDNVDATDIDDFVISVVQHHNCDVRRAFQKSRVARKEGLTTESSRAVATQERHSRKRISSRV